MKKPRWTPMDAYYHARKVGGGRCPELEPIILQDELYICLYACNVIGGRWLEAEAAIAADPRVAARYKRNVLKGRALQRAGRTI